MCKASLQACSEEFLPQQWAETQINLGKILEHLGIRSGAPTGVIFLDVAIQSYENALSVFHENPRYSYSLAEANKGSD